MSQQLIISIEYLQNQLDNTSFGYTINQNGNPITYSATSLTDVNKTFKSGITTTVGRIIGLDENLNYDYNYDFSSGFDGEVREIHTQSNGKYIVVGNFGTYRGVTLATRNICRLNTDFTLDGTFAPNFSLTSSIYTAAVDSSDRIYISSQNILSGKRRLQRLNSNGTLDTGYLNGTGFNDNVWAIALDSSERLVCAGRFTQFNTTTGGTITANGIIRLNQNGSKDTSFSGVVQGFNITESPVQRTIAFKSDGKILIGGDFTLYNNTSVGNIVELNPNGSFNYSPPDLVGPSPNVTCITVDNSDNYYVGGNFILIGGGIPQNRLVKFNPSGIYDSTLFVGTGFNDVVNDVKIDTDGNLIVVGNFTDYGGTAMNKLTKINISGSVITGTNYAADFNDEINWAYIVPNGTYVLGGKFTTYTNLNVFQTPTIIPLASASTLTQTNTENNFILFNQHPQITYSSATNYTYVIFTYPDGDTADVTNVFDIPNYLKIKVNGIIQPPKINILNQPQYLVPAYNPIVFKFSSPNYNNTNFRYLIDLYNEKNDDLIASFKLSPQVDGTGYIDLSKIIGNEVSVDFNTEEILIEDAINTYLNFKTNIGAEYSEVWNFDDVLNYTGDTVFDGYVQLVNSNLNPYTFTAGTQITISSNASNEYINGLHSVVKVIDDYSFIIDMIYPDTPITITSGSVTYANNRKTKYSNIVELSGFTAFNGVRAWNDFINWKSIEYTILDPFLTPRRQSPYFLTNLPLSGFQMTYSQDMWLNFYGLYSGTTFKLTWFDSLSNTGTNGTVLNYNNVSQLAAGPTQLGISELADWYEFYLTNESNDVLTKVYRVNLDKRCKIEDYEILFMDRMGSLLSYAFPLRAIEKGTIERQQYKKNINYTLNQFNYLNAYDITDRGTSNINVTVTKTLELNTNWMSEENSLLFEELLTSPYTWIKIQGKYYACIINDKEFEVTKQKNKRLIRKTITVTLANNNNINI